MIIHRRFVGLSSRLVRITKMVPNPKMTNPPRERVDCTIAAQLAQAGKDKGAAVVLDPATGKQLKVSTGNPNFTTVFGNGLADLMDETFGGL